MRKNEGGKKVGKIPYKTPYLSVILPAYNEGDRLESAVKDISKELEKLGHNYEIIIAEDGSRDGTDKVAAKLQKKLGYVRHLHSDKRLGRGKALTNAVNAAKGEIVAFMDVDLATDLRHLHELVHAIEEEGYDYAVGSRWIRGADVKRTFDRHIASKGYNVLVRAFLRSKLRDHQCGFKMFRKKSAAEVLPAVKDEMWFWDTELLVRGQRTGQRVKEIPVKWRADGRTKVKYSRDISDMGSKIVKLWLEFLSEDVKAAFWRKRGN